MISKHSVKRLVESQTANGAVLELRRALGLADEKGRPYRDNLGRSYINKETATLSPEQCNFRAIFEGFLGEETLERFGRGGSLMEAAGVGAVTPSTFANISGFTLAIGGLLEYKILEAFSMPELVADRIAQTEPTSVLGGTKHIGVANVGDVAAERKPADPVKMIGLEDRWIQTPETVEYSAGIEITYEAIAQDLTGQILQRASQVGQSIALRKEYRVIDMMIGATNTYNYKGTSYNTYQASTPWINSHQNTLTDWTKVNAALQLFSKMRDAETGQPILVTLKDLFVMPGNLLTATKIFRDTSVQSRTQTQAVVSASNSPVLGMFDPFTSPLAYFRATATAANGGLALSDTDATALWFLGDFKKAFGYRQFHPPMVESAVPNTYDMLSRRVVTAYFAYERGVPFTKEPRYVTKNTV